jgi:glucan phosphoethanolaminetransferase (alkaline phosphatase superfamily)
VRRPLLIQGRKSRLLVVIVLLLAASGALALFAHCYFDSSVPTCGGHWYVGSCSTVTYVWKSSNQIAEGLAAAAVLLFLLMFRWPSLRWLNRPLTTRFPRWLFVIVGLVGASVFGFFAFIDATFHILSFSYHFDNLFDFKTIQATGSSFGVVAFAIWGVTVVCLSIGRGFANAMRVFGLPAILFLMALLLVCDPPTMTAHVTNFAIWSADYNNVDLVSNWFVLTVTLFLTLWGRTSPLSDKGGAAG